VASQVKVNIIKIDKSTVDKLTRQELPSTHISELLSLIAATDVPVVAEGVETAAQAEILWKYGIKIAQGWLFSHPLSAPEFIAYAEAHS
jgi:sensor c-di-GMP phosphodiesterase-like protein